jgi:hypothetical protein
MAIVAFPISLQPYQGEVLEWPVIEGQPWELDSVMADIEKV